MTPPPDSTPLLVQLFQLIPGLAALYMLLLPVLYRPSVVISQRLTRELRGHLNTHHADLVSLSEQVQDADDDGLPLLMAISRLHRRLAALDQEPNPDWFVIPDDEVIARIVPVTATMPPSPAVTVSPRSGKTVRWPFSPPPSRSLAIGRDGYAVGEIPNPAICFSPGTPRFRRTSQNTGKDASSYGSPNKRAPKRKPKSAEFVNDSQEEADPKKQKGNDGASVPSAKALGKRKAVENPHTPGESAALVKAARNIVTLRPAGCVQAEAGPSGSKRTSSGRGKAASTTSSVKKFPKDEGIVASQLTGVDPIDLSTPEGRKLFNELNLYMATLTHTVLGAKDDKTGTLETRLRSSLPSEAFVSSQPQEDARKELPKTSKDLSDDGQKQIKWTMHEWTPELVLEGNTRACIPIIGARNMRYRGCVLDAQNRPSPAFKNFAFVSNGQDWFTFDRTQVKDKAKFLDFVLPQVPVPPSSIPTVYYKCYTCIVKQRECHPQILNGVVNVNADRCQPCAADSSNVPCLNSISDPGGRLFDELFASVEDAPNNLREHARRVQFQAAMYHTLRQMAESQVKALESAAMAWEAEMRSFLALVKRLYNTHALDSLVPAVFPSVDSLNAFLHSSDHIETNADNIRPVVTLPSTSVDKNLYGDTYCRVLDLFNSAPAPPAPLSEQLMYGPHLWNARPGSVPLTNTSEGLLAWESEFSTSIESSLRKLADVAGEKATEDAAEPVPKDSAQAMDVDSKSPTRPSESGDIEMCAEDNDDGSQTRERTASPEIPFHSPTSRPYRPFKPSPDSDSEDEDAQ
ncbi:hypothetical protein CC2G_015063 [Coprinopsis cinerea AmutBmut pab1-1]|nr:hypothetical protein CC2G_015063 [Coprinopsis cinerea AmutBmut pab1-1]